MGRIFNLLKFRKRSRILELDMPFLGLSQNSGTMKKWMVKEGDYMVAGEVIAEIETEMLILEYAVSQACMVFELMVDEGYSGIKEGTNLARLITI